jgi:hypothetical protein
LLAHPFRQVYLLCLRSDMDPADQARLDQAAVVLHRAKDKAEAAGLGSAGKVLDGSALEEW